MAISYPLSLPSTPLPKTTKFTPSSVVAVGESPFTFEQQVYQHTGQRWLAEVTMPPMARAKAEAWLSTIVKLNGRYGTFLLGDWDGRNPRGSVLGTPLVNGASQTGGSLATKGWTANKTGILLAGDYIQLGSGSTSRLYKVLDDADSDSSGDATLTIWPNLRSSPADGASIVTSNTVSVFRLAAPFSWTANEMSVYGVTFSAVESL